MEPKGNILLLANTSSYLVTAMRDVLVELGLHVIALDSKHEGIRNVTEVVQGVVIYADESVMNRNDLIVYVNDYAAEKELKVFLIGEPDELAILSQAMANGMIADKFTRPIDVGAVAKKISDFVVSYAEKKSRKKSILAVDDSGVYLRQIGAWFGEKYQVALVNSGLNAIKYLGSHKPDLILLDYEMPVCNGKQVLQMIRSDTECGDIPVIFLTSNSDRDTIIEIMPLNVAGYLLKTLPAEKIKESIDKFFEENK